MDELEKENCERDLKASSLAREILSLSRSSLLVNFRFLDRALSRLEFLEDEAVSLGTDGEFIYYNPWYVLSVYSRERSAVERDLLHCVMHCVFRHFFISGDIDRLRWDAACDVTVEVMLSSLHSPALRCTRAAMQEASLAVLRESPGEPLTAERIYNWLGRQSFSEDELEKFREPFRGDGHGLWYGSFDKNAKTDKNISLRKIWEDVSKRMQTELETLSRDDESSLVQNLRNLNRSKRSYTEFLRRFGVHGEILRLSDEEFDNNYYTYGLELYGNVPLIEPLEYSEVKRIREFVIAIDTSGSVKGDVVQSFIQHTHDILMRQENFFTRVSMFIIQCDDRIEHVERVRSREDFEQYIRNLEIRGLGKTDFRPVFRYVDELIVSRQLTDLRGLIYFTDGFGTFPSEKPPYDTAFIIHGDGFDRPAVPSWAQHMTISEEDILDRRFSAY